MKRYKALVLAGCVAMSGKQIQQVKSFVKQGGRLCVIGPLATRDEWMTPRGEAAFGDLPEQNVIRIAADDDILAAINRACDEKQSLEMRPERAGDSLLGLCVELTEQLDRRLVHLVNYRSDEPFRNVSVSVHLPDGHKANSVMLASPQRANDLKISFEQEGEVVTFTVPYLNIYEIAIVEMD